MNEIEEAKKWLTENYPHMEMLPYIQKYMDMNDDITFFEAFESVDSVLYRLWCDR